MKGAEVKTDNFKLCCGETVLFGLKGPCMKAQAMSIFALFVKFTFDEPEMTV